MVLHGSAIDALRPGLCGSRKILRSRCNCKISTNPNQSARRGDDGQGGVWPSTNFHRDPSNTTVFRKKKYAKNTIKRVFFGVLGVQISNFFLIFVKIFQKCQNIEKSRGIWSYLMYNVVLKLKIGGGAEGSAKILRIRLHWANLTPCNSTILQFWGPSNSTIFENFRSPPSYSSPLI